MKIQYYFVLLLMGLVIFSCEELLDPDNSSLDPRDRLNDYWTVYEENNLLKTATTYDVDIINDPNDTLNILILNFYQLGWDYEVTAKLSGKSLLIKSQEVGGFVISGSGTITNNYNQIDWTYQVDYQDGDIYSVTATYQRKE